MGGGFGDPSACAPSDKGHALSGVREQLRHQINLWLQDGGIGNYKDNYDHYQFLCRLNETFHGRRGSYAKPFAQLNALGDLTLAQT